MTSLLLKINDIYEKIYSEYKKITELNINKISKLIMKIIKKETSYSGQVTSYIFNNQV